MSNRKAKNGPKTESIAGMFLAFVEENPKLATAIAFELGALVGKTVRDSGETKRYLKRHAKNMPQAIADAVPAGISSALKFLPAPTLQPRKRAHAKSRKA
ncbi:MAG: hypothetical protein ABI830_00670 [Pseudolabrys sp.]